MRFNLVNCKTWVEIDAAALRHNLSIFEKLTGDTRIMAVVKANAYGHGIAEVANILATSAKINPRVSSLKSRENQNAKIKTTNQNSKLFFGVDTVDEALLMRNLNIKNSILALGYIPREQLKEATENDISFSVYSKDLLEMIAKKQWQKNPRVHIKIETGTNRLGMRLKELTEAAPLLKKRASWIEGVYTHFAETENPLSSFWKEQIARFDEAVAFLKNMGCRPIRHAASSAGALLYPETRYDMVRVGIGLYGLWPSRDIKSRIMNHKSWKKKIFLKPVLSWKTRIAQIKKIKKGETVGYDRTWSAKRPATIAILPVGYWDGYDRHISHKGEVLIRGARAPVAGRVCMNMIMADVTDIKHIAMGDEATLLGVEITAEDIAEKIGTINYEVVARINPLIPRRII